jgi:hypothetical protein
LLYGKTLRPYLFSEVIGQAILAGSELPAAVIVTDQREMLPLGLIRREPVIHVEPAPRMESGEKLPLGGQFDLAGCCATMADVPGATAEELQVLFQPLAAHIDLCEPFDRIRAALTEAQLTSHDAAESANDHTTAA